MVLLNLMSTLQDIATIIAILTPILLTIIGILVRKGTISREKAQDAEDVIHILASSVEAFKGENKPASKALTELIDIKAVGAEVQKPLSDYLEKFNLNK